MTHSSLHGLNIIHPQSQNSPESSSLDLTTSSFPDLSAQLDLWTNLAFHSDEPIIPNDDNYLNASKKTLSDELVNDDENASFTREGVAVHKGHVNVITGRPLLSNLELKSSNSISSISNSTVSNSTNGAPSSASTDSAIAAAIAAATNVTSTNSGSVITGANPALPPFDINALLAGFGINPYALPPQQAAFPTIAPSLAQLIALHTAQTAATPGFQTQVPTPLQNGTGGVHPLFPLTHPSPDLEPSASSSAQRRPPSKRARTQNLSISTDSSDHLLHADLHQPQHLPEPDLSTPVTASEDKRRRNTAASARFRLKKKEREAALESKAKELESKVTELERECEGLRRENGWLKGLVVGVTGAGAVQQTQAMEPVGRTKRNRVDVDKGGS